MWEEARVRHAPPDRNARAAGRFAPLACARARLAAALAVLAILAQLFAPAFARAAGPADAAAALRAALGDAVVFCLQSDDAGAAHNPLDPAGSCDDHCPLCQLHAHAAALLAPTGVADIAPSPATGFAIAARIERELAPIARHALAQPRAPPIDI